MARETHAVNTVVALLLLAPTLAAVIIGTLLLLGVKPHLVFLPGFVVLSTLKTFGFRAPNAVGVLSTLILWWGIVIVIWLGLQRVWRGRRRKA
jgi:hypothetical protein